MTEVDICNLALSHIGDAAEVVSIDPPDGTMQAALCCKFYPAARDAILELQNWGFATRRVDLPLKAFTVPEWQYAYGLPQDAIAPLEVYASDAGADYSTSLILAGTTPGAVNSGVAIYTPQEFVCEIGEDDSQVLYTNVANAALRYCYRVTDPQRFPGLFVQALSWLLASQLAGPIIKGSAGAGMAKDCAGQFRYFLAQSGESDANQRRSTPVQSTPWVVNR